MLILSCMLVSHLAHATLEEGTAVGTDNLTNAMTETIVKLEADKADQQKIHDQVCPSAPEGKQCSDAKKKIDQLQAQIDAYNGALPGVAQSRSGLVDQQMAEVAPTQVKGLDLTSPGNSPEMDSRTVLSGRFNANGNPILITIPGKEFSPQRP